MMKSIEDKENKNDLIALLDCWERKNIYDKKVININ